MEQEKTVQQRLLEIGEYFGAGFMEFPDDTAFARFSRAWRRYLENCPLQPYNGEPLYPCGRLWLDYAVEPNYSYTVVLHDDRMRKKDPGLISIIREQMGTNGSQVPGLHAVGGNMYTHSYPNFGRIVKEGLDSYRQRVEQIEASDIRRGLLDVLEGISCFRNRALGLLREQGADLNLIRALEKVPFRPAQTLYEAMVCWNFIYYMDLCDDIGRLDADLIHLYRGEDMTEVIRCFFQNADANDGWSGSVGPDYNPLTVQVIHACKGIRRPSIQLRVKQDMPQQVWDAALDSICAGGGSPTLYNEDVYQRTLKEMFPEIPDEDRMRFAGGGCTETMLAGISNVGSTDAGVNLALVFEQVMREKLPTANSFEEFYQALIHEIRKVTEMVMDSVSESQRQREKTRPQPMRTLLIDDCIDRGMDFNKGGARFTGSTINLAGMINVIDSLQVIRRLVFEDGIMDGQTLLDKLDRGERFKQYRNIPRHGIDHPEVNALAARLSKDILAVFDGKVPHSGGRFFPGSIQFTTYISAGKNVGATPDGRQPGEPLCDCIGAIHGNDIKGVTALMNSACALEQQKMIATPVTNIKLDAKQANKGLKALTNAYFRKGGMQLQVTCVSKEDLLAAREHPERYPNLIVRIGGYSEYFTRLTPELQQTVIDRTVYGL